MSYTLKDLVCRSNITIELVDDSVLYKAELMSSIGNIFRNNDSSTDITLVIFKGVEDITNRFSDIEWKRFTFNSNGQEDKTWGNKHKGKTSITVTKEEIEGKAVIQCSVYAKMSGERKLVAAQSITFIDINDMVPSSKPPLHPIDGEIWIDNSVDPPVIKVWDEKKGQWVTITVANSSTKNLVNNSNFFKDYGFTDFKLTQGLNDYRIAPYQGKKYANLRADSYEDSRRGFYQDIQKSYYPEEIYLIQAKAYSLDLTGMYDGGLTLEVCDVTTRTGPNLEEIEEENTLVEKSFKLKPDKIQNVFTTFTMPQTITKLRVYIYGEKNTAFHIAVTEISLSHNSKIHEWELSDDDMQWKLDNKLNNDPKSVFNALTDNGKMQGIYTAINPDTGKDDYYINANYIKSGKVDAEHIQAKGLTVTKEITSTEGNKTVNTLEVTKDGSVHILADKLSIMPYAETNISTKDEVDIKLKNKVDADKDSIINTINDTGIFIDKGKLVLNADNVSTGILKSRNNMSVFNLNAGTFRLGQSDSFYKMKFDGEDLLFGAGAIKWDNLDNGIIEELTPYDVYLEKTSVIVTEEINSTEVQGDVIPDIKPINKVLATKGNNKLTPVDTVASNGEFSFRILEQNGCIAKKNGPDSFYVDKVQKESSFVRVSISCENKQTITRTMTITKTNIEGTVGPPGDPGEDGSMAAFIYCKSKERPEKPTGNHPSGWYERIEEIIENGDLWCSQGIRNSKTGELEGEWQVPYKLEKQNNNLLANYPWIPGEGAYSIYTPLGLSTENRRINDKDPKGNYNVCWQAISQDANDIMDFIDGGFSASVKIDPMKTYRFSVWAKQSDKNCYINMSADVTNTNDINGDAQPNPVFYSSPLPEVDKWYLIVGYVLGAGNPHVPTNSGVYDSKTGERILIEGSQYSLPTFKNKDSANKQTIKVYMSGGEQIGVNAKFYDPRIEIVDGEEASLDSLLGKLSDMKWIYEWNGTKTEINGSSVLTPKLFTGSIDEASGKHTGIALGMNVVGDGKNGMVGYSKGIKTFHINTDGSAIFGADEKERLEIGTDGSITLPIVHGNKINANNLVVKLLNERGEPVLDKQGKEIHTIEITDKGEVIMHPTKFEMLSTITGGGGGDTGGESSPDALVPQLQQLGFKFENNPPKFVINASQITTGKLAADKLDLYGLTIYKKGYPYNKTLEVTSDGSVKINASDFLIESGYSTESLDTALDSEHIATQIAANENAINMISQNINLTGYVTFSDLSRSGKTSINGANIKTGTIYCDAIGTCKKDAIIKLFEHNGNLCALDATESMNKGKGTAIRLKWDDNNYVYISNNSIKFYTEYVKGWDTISNSTFSIYNSGISVSGGIAIYKNPNTNATGNFGAPRDFSYIDNIYCAHVHSKFSNFEHSDQFPKTNLLAENNEPEEYSFFKFYNDNVEYMKEIELNKNSEINKMAIDNNENNSKKLITHIEGTESGFLMDVGIISEMQSKCLETIINKFDEIQSKYSLLEKRYKNLNKQLISLMEVK